MPRSEKKSQEVRERIRSLYIYQGLSERGVVDTLNPDAAFVRMYGKISLAGVHYHVVKIRADFERLVGIDAIDRYVADFIRLQQTMDGEVDQLNKMLEGADDEELKLKIMRMRHDVYIDKMKMLQDVELPLQVKKLKSERRNKLEKLKLIKDEPIIDLRSLDGTNSVQTVSEEQNTNQ